MSAHDETKRRDFSCYDQMSTAELEQILHLDFLASEDGDSDWDTILYISDLLSKRNPPLDVDAAWAQFQTKYRPYADGRSLYDLEETEEAPSPSLSPAKPKRTHRLGRILVLAAALSACLMGGMVAAQANGVSVLKTVANWTDETFRFQNVSSVAPSPQDTEQTGALSSESVMQTWEEEGRFPTWQPEGFTREEPSVTENHTSVAVNLTYLGEERSYSVTIQQFLRPMGQMGTFEKDDTPVEAYEHNGQIFYILSNLDTLTATCYDGEFMTMIAGMLTRDEIKAVIDSILGSQPSQNHAQLQNFLAQKNRVLYYPTIPKGFTLLESNLNIDSSLGDATFSVAYTQGEQSILFLVTYRNSSDRLIYEKDSTPVEEYVYNGTTHYLFENLGSRIAAWLDGNVEYSLILVDTDLDMKELIRSVYSV